MSGRGFIDLRQSSGSGTQTDDSVWPSFTDIMTVVVMIFLMALVAILLRNTELTSKLKLTIEKEQQAATLAEQRSDESTSLRASIERLTASLQSLQRDRDLLEVQHTDLTKAYGELESEHTTLGDTQKQTLAENASQSQLLALQARSLVAAEAARTAMAVSQQAASDSRQALISQSSRLSASLDDTQSELNARTRQYSELEKTLIASEAARAALALSKKSSDEQRVALVDRGRELTITLENAEQSLEAARIRTGKLQSTLTEVQAERQQLLVRGDELAEQLLSTRGELSESQQRAATLEKNLEQEKLTAARFNETNLALEEKRVELVASGEELQAQLTEAREQVASLRGETVDLLARISDQRAKNEIDSAKLSELNQELANAESERSGLSQSLAAQSEERERERTALNTDLAQKKSELDRLRDAINLLEQQLSAGDIARAESEQQLNAALSAVRSSNTQAMSANLDLKQRVETTTRTISQLRADKQSLETTLESVKNDLSTEKESLLAAIEAAEQDIAAGQQAIDALRAGKQQSETTEQQLRSEVAALILSLKEREVDVERISEELKFDRTRYQVLSDAMASIGNEKAALAEALAESERRIRGLSTDKLRLSAEVTVLGGENEQLLTTTAELEQERMSLYERLKLDQDELQQLKFTYVDLKDRYDKLVGPARSPIGRVVVDIRHFREANSSVIELREPDSTDFTVVSSEQLEARLAQLAEQHNDNLYTRIIFPKNNGLTYTEALQFETSILERYDYYDRLQQSRSRG